MASGRVSLKRGYKTPFFKRHCKCTYVLNAFLRRVTPLQLVRMYCDYTMNINFHNENIVTFHKICYNTSQHK